MAGPSPGEVTDTPSAAPANDSKKLFSIFAPSSGPSSSSSTSAAARQPSTGKGKGKDKALSRTEASEGQGRGGSVVSLLSDEDEEEPVVAPKRTRAAQGKRRAAVTSISEGLNGKRKAARQVSTTDEDSSALDSDEDDADLEVLSDSTAPSRASSSTRASRATRTTRTKSRLSETASTSSAVLDLTLSPPRPARPASSSSFAPLSEVYKSQREKRRKDAEGIEPRWPTAEEHAAGRSELVGSTQRGDWGVWEAKIRRSLPVKGKERAHDGQNGHCAEGDFLERLEQDLDFPSLASNAPSPAHSTSHIRYSTISCPFASLPSLLPDPLPSHPLLARLAAPFLSSDPSSLPSTSNSAAESELWTVKYAPQNADEVLGDESRSSAILLREWLTELKVEGASACRTSMTR